MVGAPLARLGRDPDGGGCQRYGEEGAAQPCQGCARDDGEHRQCRMLRTRAALHHRLRYGSFDDLHREEDTLAQLAQTVCGSAPGFGERAVARALCRPRRTVSR